MRTTKAMAPLTDPIASRIGNMNTRKNKPQKHWILSQHYLTKYPVGPKNRIKGMAINHISLIKRATK